MKKILILWHERETRQDRGTLIGDLAKLWQERGLKVSHVYGTQQHPEADLLIPHIDLTRTPPEYIDYIRSYPAAINCGMLRYFQAQNQQATALRR